MYKHKNVAKLMSALTYCGCESSCNYSIYKYATLIKNFLLMHVPKLKWQFRGIGKIEILFSSPQKDVGFTGSPIKSLV
jgi:hypothetical protein